jgi:hypothetical protein
VSIACRLFDDVVSALSAQYREKERLLANHLCPADNRIQTFLYDYLQDAPLAKLPAHTFVLDRYGLARALSLPPSRDDYASDIVNSYRIKQGVLHNPKSDRRTTQGIFHVTEGGLPIPDDKSAVPKRTFGRMLQLALTPPHELMRLPFTSAQEEQAECFVSPSCMRPDRLARPFPGSSPEKSMEIRFFAPGNLVSNLDFVESIFGNGGDPFLPENDAGLDPEHWSRPHRLHDSRPAFHHREEEATRVCRSGMPRPSGRNATACAGKTRTNFTTTVRRFQTHLPRRSGRDRHHHRRQLLRLLQEGGEDPA